MGFCRFLQFLSVCQYGLSVRGLGIELVVFRPVLYKTSRPWGRSLSRSRQAWMYHVLLGRCNRPSIFLPLFVDFYAQPPTFAAVARVVGSAVGSAPVEHLWNLHVITQKPLVCASYTITGDIGEVFWINSCMGHSWSTFGFGWYLANITWPTRKEINCLVIWMNGLWLCKYQKSGHLQCQQFWIINNNC